ncbi:MAG: GH32 C-terminal domain-containing protein, partial [Planctomycetota bacterium]
GEQFDGIILNQEGRWEAGSDEKKRTKPTGAEVRTGKMEQIAIVYKGSEIRMYRDGELVTKYSAQNIDLLSSNENFVVFGRSHYGGDDFITAEIEDARIYSQALSARELNTLKPNQLSKIQPYAWWDFEGDEFNERMGRFVEYNCGDVDDYELEGGKLILHEYGEILAARKYVTKTPQWPKNPPADWVTYHLAHPGPEEAEPGDPNPAYYYKGRNHLHYIIADHYGFHYAHVSSDDLVHWTWHPTILSEPFTGHGMFSGTGFFTKEGRPAMIYHGEGSGKNWITYALDDTLDKWEKPHFILLTGEDGEEPEIEYFWDPDCWLNGDTYYALSGGKNPPLMKSKDLKKWTFMGDLLHEDYKDEPGIPRDEDISCANMFKIGNKWMLLCISHRLGCRYFLGNFEDEKYKPEFHARMNWVDTDWEEGHGGLVYFAPESMLTKDGRRVMWAWLMAESFPLTGIQSLPRELELPADGVLRIRPLRELESLRYDEIIKKNITVKSDSDYKLDKITGDAVELKVTFGAPLPKAFGIKLLGDKNNKNGISITAGSGLNTISIGKINPPFELEEGEDLTLRVFIDKNLVEVFANERQAAAVAHEYIREHPNISLFTKDAPVKIKEVRTWKMHPSNKW